MYKKCSKCGIVKNISDFSKMKKSPMGVRPDCKDCKYAQDKVWRDNNKDIVKQRRDSRQKKITDEVNKKRQSKLKVFITKYNGLKLSDTIYITKYIGYIKEPNTKYKRHFFERICIICNTKNELTTGDIEGYIESGIECPYCKGTIRKNEDILEKKCKSCEVWLPLNDDNFGKSVNRRYGYNYYCKNCKNKKSRKRRESKEIRDSEYSKKKIRLTKDPLFKLTCNTRNLIRNSFKRQYTSKSKKTTEILGCNFEQLKSHIESKFELWMNWDNYGLYNGDINYGWDIDHKVPVCTAANEEELIKLNHYTNLQPLCGYTNRYIKRDKQA